MSCLKTVLFALLISAVSVNLAFAENAERTAKVISMEGTVQVKTAGGGWIPAVEGMELHERDIVKTGADSTAVLNVNGNGEIATVDVSPNSEVMLAELIRDTEKGTQQTLLDLAIGKILIKAQKLHSESERFEVKTPTTIVGVRGTTFEVDVTAAE